MTKDDVIKLKEDISRIQTYTCNHCPSSWTYLDCEKRCIMFKLEQILPDIKTAVPDINYPNLEALLEEEGMPYNNGDEYNYEDEEGWEENYDHIRETMYKEGV